MSLQCQSNSHVISSFRGGTDDAELSSTRRRADQPADNGANRRRAKRDPSGVPATVMDVVNDMMPRRRRRAMRTMPPVMRRGNRRTSRQNHPSHENRECLDDLVHITPTFPDFLSLHKGRQPSFQFLTEFFYRIVRVPISRPLPSR